MNLREATRQVLDCAKWSNDEQAIVPYEQMMNLRAALINTVKDCGEAGHNEGRCGNASCLHARQTEPVAWLDPWTQANVTTDYDAYGKHGIPLYATPPKREPLTDEEIKRIKPVLVEFVSFRSGVRCAEREHGIGGEEND